jgi:hypothetical protein
MTVALLLIHHEWVKKPNSKDDIFD